MWRPVAFLAASLLVLAGCARPGPGSYVHEHAGAGARLPLGDNTAGEACTQHAADADDEAGGAGADIYCGTWEQPSAHVRAASFASGRDLDALATSSPWRSEIDGRDACAAPHDDVLLGRAPARLLNCTSRNGGWPAVALVAEAGGRIWYASGVAPALPAIERSIGVLSGMVSAAEMRRHAPPSTAASDALYARRLAAQPFRAADVGRYDALMQAGTRANLNDDFPSAEAAFHAAALLQRRALGAQDQAVANPLMHEALQLSDQGRAGEADALFAQADRLAHAGGTPDPILAPRLLHYEGLARLNQHRPDEAAVLLRRARDAYDAQLPPGSRLTAEGASRGTELDAVSRAMAAASVLEDEDVANALRGAIETRRYLAEADEALGDHAAADREIREAEHLAARVNQPLVVARLYRSAARVAVEDGRARQALADLDRSAAAFSVALPESRPEAETALIRAAALAGAGHGKEALAACKDGIGVLRRLRQGDSGAHLETCLGLLEAEAQAATGAHRERLLADTFEAAELVQGGLTIQQIAQASARLSVNSRDPRAASAIRAQQDAQNALAVALRRRSLLVAESGGANAAQAADLESADHAVTAAETVEAGAERSLQAAAPNYGELVAQVTRASDVLAALRPGETFVAAIVTPAATWDFALHDGTIEASRAAVGEAATETAIKRLRASIEPTTAALPPFDAADARAIFRQTLGAFAATLARTQALVVEPSGPLLSIPFSILLTRDAPGGGLADAPWLVRDMTVTHVPAASNFVSLRRIAGGSHAAESWFGFGDFRPVTAAEAQASFPGAACRESAQLFAGLPPLAGSRRELDAARAITGGDPGSEMLGGAFTVDAVLHANLSNYRILHFATHAILPSDLPCLNEPVIVTSAPGGARDAHGAMLTADDVTTLKLDADLVILSACNSGGVGSGTGGESLSGLARSFFYAGARALLVTHWSVNDQAAAYLIANMLHREREGASAAAALRAAELELLAGAQGSSANLAHPFFWAPFALIGEGQGAAWHPMTEARG